MKGDQTYTAKFVGAMPQDKVVAYLVPHAKLSGKYDMMIAGAGGVKAPADCHSLFSGYGLTTVNFTKFLNTEKITNMSSMFSGCSSLSSLDVSSFNTSNVTNMGYMFYRCSSLTSLNLSSFNTSNVTNMGYMFYGCSSLTSLNLSSFNTSNVTNMNSMFKQCYHLTSLDLSSFDTSKVTDMKNMFNRCGELTTLKLQNDQGEGNFYLADEDYYDPFEGEYGLFGHCGKLGTVEGIRLHEKYSQLDLRQIFNNHTWNYAQNDYNGYDNGLRSLWKVTFVPAEGGTAINCSSLKGMFEGCSSLVYVDMHGWNMPKLTDVREMFYGCTDVELAINMSWSELPDATEVKVDDIAKGRSTFAALIVGDKYDSSTDTAMTKIIMAFPVGTCAYSAGSYDSGRGRVICDPADLVYSVSSTFSRAPARPAAPAYTVETWLDDETKAADIRTVEYTAADVTFTDDGGTTTTTCAIPTVEGYDFAYALFGESAEHLTVGDMTVSIPVTGDPEADVLKLYYTTAVDETPKAVQYTVEYYVDEEIKDSLTEAFEAKDGEEITAYPDHCPEGWHLEKAENLPLIVTDGEENVIKVYYAKDEPVTAAYTVYTWYGEEKSEQVEYTGTVTDDAVTYVVPAAKEGYHFDHADPTAEEVEGGWTVTLPVTPEENVINVYYAADVQKDDPDDVTPSESTHAPDLENEEFQESENAAKVGEEGEEGGEEGTEALSLARTNRRMAVDMTEDGPRKYTEDELVGINEHPDVYKQPMVTALVPTPKDSTLTYKVVVRYTGDSGVQSGRIDIRYPLPEGVEAAENPNIQIGGTAKDEPSVGNPLEDFKLTEDGRVLTGAISGLPAGKNSKGEPYTYEVSIDCVLAELNEPPKDGYYYWDGSAYAQTSNEAVSSNILRLWWKEKAGADNPNPPASGGEVVVKYQFIGTVLSEGVELPPNKTVKVKEPVTLPTVQVPSGYIFDGWYKLNGDGTKFEMGKQYDTDDADVTFYGKWAIDNKTVTYPEFKDEDEDEKPDKNPEDTTANVQVGKIVTADLNEGIWTKEQKEGWEPTDDKDVFTQKMEPDITLPDPTRDGYVFVGWIKTEEMDLETDEKTGNVKFTAQYLPDTKGGKDPETGEEKSDGIPDEFQKKVTFTVEHGKWDDGTTADIVVYVELKDAGGRWSTSGSGTLTAPTDMRASTGFTGGAWSEPVPETVTGTEAATYTYRFTRRTRPGGGGGGTGGNGSNTGNTGTGGNNGTVIYDPEVPLAAPGLNSVDHFDYIKGYSDGTVQPEANITRAEVATIFFRLMTNEYRTENWSTENSFSDVKSSSWYNNAVSTAAKAGILAGYPNGSFQPNKTITRAEFAAIAARFASEAVPSGKMFSDIEGHWAQESIERASAAGWIRGNNGKFRPNDQITRAEVVTAINRMLDRIPDAEHMLEGMRTFPDNTPDKWYYADIQEATNSHDYERGENGSDEIWTALLPEQDWAALEKEWANAADANVNDVASGLKEED